MVKLMHGTPTTFVPETKGPVYTSNYDAERIGGIFLLDRTSKEESPIYTKIGIRDLGRFLESDASLTYTVKQDFTAVHLRIEDINEIDELVVMLGDDSVIKGFPEVRSGSSKPLEGIVAEFGQHLEIVRFDYNDVVVIYPGIQGTD